MTGTLPAEPRAGTGDLIFSSVFSGAFASAAPAVVFLAKDAMRGDPFTTPSLLGSAVFLGADPATVTTVSAAMVALYTIVHLATFMAFGTAFTLLYHRARRVRNPFMLGLLVFVVLNTGVAVVDRLLLPGIVGAIGLSEIALANFMAALAMTLTIVLTRPTGDAAGS